MKLFIITGPSGSGKTTLSDLLSKSLNYSYILRTDNYYKTDLISKFFSKFIKSYFDKHISLNKNLIQKDLKAILENNKINHVYKYDFISKKRSKLYRNISKIDYLIIEGIFGLEIAKSVKMYDYTLIRLNTSKDFCRDRIYIRDNKERGKNKEKLLVDFNNAWDIYKKKESNFKFNKIKKLISIKDSSDINLILKIITTNIS